MRNSFKSTELPEAFINNFREFSIDTPYEEHRRGSNYYVQNVVRIRADGGDYEYLDAEEGSLEEFKGTWISDVYLDDYEYGMDDPPAEFYRVEQVEVKKLEWRKVEEL